MSYDFCKPCHMWTWQPTGVGCLGCQRRAENAAKEQAERDVIAARRQWFVDHGHCGACGSPGNYCQCRVPCPCSDLHDVGSGLGADAAVVFAETDVDQMELFDE